MTNGGTPHEKKTELEQASKEKAVAKRSDRPKASNKNARAANDTRPGKG